MLRLQKRQCARSTSQKRLKLSKGQVIHAPTTQRSRHFQRQQIGLTKLVQSILQSAGVSIDFGSVGRDRFL
jgi:hypothetical protein